jgi:hypothetical protein
MKAITQHNGDDAPGASTATIYFCHPLRSHKRIACTACGNSFAGEPLVRYFYEADRDWPVCKKCALRHGFMIVRNDGTQLHCRRAASGAIEIVPVDEGTPDRKLDDELDRWLTGFQDEEN